MNYKICTTCNKKLIANSENFQKHRMGKFGFYSKCKPCEKERMKAYRSTDEYKKKHREDMAICRKENPKKAEEIRKKCYNKNKESINEKRRELYKNSEEFRQKKREQELKYIASGGRKRANSKPETMEKARERSRKRRENSEKKKIDQLKGKEWREKNKAKILANDKKRREKLDHSYVACCMRIKVKNLTPELYEAKKLLIQLDREIKKQKSCSE